MLAGEGQTQHWMKNANGNDPEKTLELQPGDRETLVPYYMTRLRELPSDSTWPFLGLSQSHPTGIRFRFEPRSPMNLCIVITVGF